MGDFRQPLSSFGQQPGWAGFIKNDDQHSRLYIKQATQTQERVWWNYWDYCPRHERDYRIRQLYLLNNPIKHGCVDNLRDYPFSSFHETLTVQGTDVLRQQFREYPEFRTLVLGEAYDDDF